MYLLCRVLNASTTWTELSCVFVQLFPSLKHRTDVNNGTAGWCPEGPYVFSGLDHYYESLSLSFENQMCLCCYIFKKSGKWKCCLDGRTRLFPVLNKTSGNTQPLGLYSFLKDPKRCLSHVRVPWFSCLGVFLQNNRLDEQIPFYLVWHVSNWFQSDSHNIIQFPSANSF